VISQIDEFKGTWRALGTLAPDRLSALRRLMTELVTRFVDERKTKHLHPLLLIGVWVVVLLETHLFQDGPGRLSRVRTTLRRTGSHG
jgi:hypothetical protein